MFWYNYIFNELYWCNNGKNAFYCSCQLGDNYWSRFINLRHIVYIVYRKDYINKLILIFENYLNSIELELSKQLLGEGSVVN